MDEPSEMRACDEALNWSIRVRGAEADSDVRRKLDAWIACDPLHASAWAKVERSWALMSAVGPAHEAEWSTAPRHAAGIERAERRRLRRMLPAMAGLAACALAIVSAPSLLLWARADYSTGIGEIRQVTLADGTTVHLDSGSAISLDYHGNRRGVTLLSGQAYFDVAHDTSRPFTVHVHAVDVTVLGTAFDVRREGGAVEVAVQRGAVRVASASMTPVVLHPGEAVHVDGVEAQRSHVPVGRIAVWREGQIVVNGATVADVVAELGRYHRGFILLRNDWLGQRPITGSYDIRDPEAALRAMVHPYGGQIRAIGGLLFIVS